MAWCQNCGERAIWRKGFCSPGCAMDWDARYSDDDLSQDEN